MTKYLPYFIVKFIMKCLPASWLSIAFSDTHLMLQFCFPKASVYEGKTVTMSCTLSIVNSFSAMSMKWPIVFQHFMKQCQYNTWVFNIAIHQQNDTYDTQLTFNRCPNIYLQYLFRLLSQVYRKKFRHFLFLVHWLNRRTRKKDKIA